jgi:hypothetical protein
LPKGLIFLNFGLIMASAQHIEGTQPIEGTPNNAGASKRMQRSSKRMQQGANGFSFTDLMLFGQRWWQHQLFDFVKRKSNKFGVLNRATSLFPFGLQKF